MSQLHQRKRSETSKSDEFYTPKSLAISLFKKYKINPKLDVCATHRYHLCRYYFTKEDDALKQEWLIKAGTKKTGVFVQPPNSLTQKFIAKASEQYYRYNLNIIMLIPINSTVTKNGVKYLWEDSNVEIYPVIPTPRFIYNGVQQKNARNRYCVVLFRKKP